jgi:hypothetical protein
MSKPEPKPQRAPWRDPIVAEVRQARERLFAAAGHDLAEFCRRLRGEQTTSGHAVVAPPRDSDRP